MRFNSTTTLTLMISFVVILTGCGGGGVGGNSQNPDPVVVDFAIAYVKRPVLLNNQGAPVQGDVRDLLAFSAGGDLYVRDRASPGAAERNITNVITTGMGDVKDIEASLDGTKFIFAIRKPDIQGANPEDQPTWNIWEYDIIARQLRRIITSNITAEAGQDIAPHYLPDGRIIFSSTRQRQTKATLLDEGKPQQYAGLDENLGQHAFILHVMSANGDDIHQVSFNQSHDLDPTVLSDGKVLFSRWDNMGSRNAISLYKMEPDGSEIQQLYGAHSHDSGTTGSTVHFLQPREWPDGRIMTILRPFTSTDDGGNIIQIDTDNYVDNMQPTAVNQGILTGPAQVATTINNVSTSTAPSPGGRFRSAYPLWDGTNRLLVSWSQCRLLENNIIVPCTTARLADPNVQEAPPLYGIFIYDVNNDTQLPIIEPQEGIIYTEVVVAQSRSNLPIIFDKTRGVELNPDHYDEGVGVLHIRSVYDFDGSFNDLGTPATGVTSVADLADPIKVTADERPARFLRILKGVPIPDDNVRDFRATAFGAGRQQLMREIISYTAIEPDGSVKLKVPANVPLAISVLDKNGRRIGSRHQNWIQVRPGETITCNGCHNHNPAGNNLPLPHGRPDAAANAINTGAAVTGLPFPNTDPTLFADTGETMAETRTRLDPTALNPGVNIIYDDIWTNPPTFPSFSYLYSALTTAAPASVACQTSWTKNCRTIINYEQHIQPLWDKLRQTLDINGMVIQDNTCTSCHSPMDINNNPRVPAGQLDLSNTASNQVADRFTSYQELLFSDNEQELAVGTLQDRLVPAIDPITLLPIMVPVIISPSMSSAGALASGAFFNKFDASGSHTGRLDSAELRLLSEWLDIGGQYYNNPFDAPLN